MMKRYLALTLTALLLSSLLLSGNCQDDDIEDIDVVEEEKAFLIVRKNVLDREKVVVGLPVTVEIEVHNAGTSSALDVEVEDEAWPSPMFKHGDGSLKWETPRLPAGATKKFSYTISPLSAGFYSSRPARVTYRDVPDATEPRVGTSSSPHFNILTGFQRYVQTGLLAGSYLTLGQMRTVADWRNVSIVLGLLVAVFGGRHVYKNVTDARAKSLYQRSLEEVNKWK
jgi:hypothetical protein